MLSMLHWIGQANSCPAFSRPSVAAFTSALALAACKHGRTMPARAREARYGISLSDLDAI